jgi:hypothetical protein
MNKHDNDTRGKEGDLFKEHHKIIGKCIDSDFWLSSNRFSFHINTRLGRTCIGSHQKVKK